MGKNLNPFWVDEHDYNVTVMYYDAKILVFGEKLGQWERMPSKARLPWSERKTIAIESDIQILEMFRLFKETSVEVFIWI